MNSQPFDRLEIEEHGLGFVVIQRKDCVLVRGSELGLTSLKAAAVRASGRERLEHLHSLSRAVKYSSDFFHILVGHAAEERQAQQL